MSPRTGLQIAVSTAVLALLLWQLDVGQTVELIGSSDPRYLLAALAIYLATTWALAWRWQLLLAPKGIHEPLGWLTRQYFVGQAAGQVLPTAVGGDAVRIVQHARRRPGAKADVVAAVLMERMLGGAATLLIAGIALIAAAGRYEGLRPVALVELVLVAATAIVLVLIFSGRIGRSLGARRFPLASLYRALHGYRGAPVALSLVIAVTTGVQVARIAAIGLCGEAAGLDVSPVVYLLLGPLLFLVQMVPVTLNGLGVREAFFVAVLTAFGADADAAFAAGFLWYAVTIAASLPGAFLLLRRGARPARDEPSVLSLLH